MAVEFMLPPAVTSLGFPDKDQRLTAPTLCWKSSDCASGESCFAGRYTLQGQLSDEKFESGPPDGFPPRINPVSGESNPRPKDGTCSVRCKDSGNCPLGWTCLDPEDTIHPTSSS